MDLAIDPLRVSAVNFQIPAQTANLRRRFRHRLRHAGYRRIAKIRGVSSALSKTQRISQAVGKLRGTKRLIVAECSPAALPIDRMKDKPWSLISRVIRGNVDYIACRVESWSRANLGGADK